VRRVLWERNLVLVITQNTLPSHTEAQTHPIITSDQVMRVEALLMFVVLLDTPDWATSSVMFEW